MESFGESDSKMTLTPSSAAVVYGFGGGEYDVESGKQRGRTCEGQ